MESLNITHSIAENSSVTVNWQITDSTTQYYDILIERRLSTSQEFTSVSSLLSRPATGSHVDLTVVDSVSPDPVGILYKDITYNYSTKQLTVPIENTLSDSGTFYTYRITATGRADGEISQSEMNVEFISGIQDYLLNVNTTSSTSITAGNSIGIVNSKVITVVDDTLLNYIHCGSIDNDNNLSITNHNVIDLAAPPKVSSLSINDIPVTGNLQTLSFTTNKLVVSSNAVSQTRGMLVYYDFKLVNNGTSAVIAEVNGVTNPNDVDLHIDPFASASITDTTVLRLDVRTYTIFNSSLGNYQSYTFKVDFNDPLTIITFTNTPTRFITKADIDSSRTIPLQWSLTDTGSGTTIVNYDIEYRYKLPSDLSWTSWSVIKGAVVGTSTTIPVSLLHTTGTTMHEFRIRGRNSSAGYTLYFNFPYYFSDLLIVTYENTDKLVYAIRIPVEVSRELGNIKLETYKSTTKIDTSYGATINGNIVTSTIGDGKFSLVGTYHSSAINSFNDTAKYNALKDNLSDSINTVKNSYNCTKVGIVGTSLEYVAGESDIYIVGTYLTSDMAIFNGVTFTYSNIVGLNSNFSAKITTALPSETNLTLIPSYSLLKYNELLPPVLNYSAAYQPVNTVGSYDEFIGGIGIASSKPAGQSSLPNTTISTSYVLSTTSETNSFPNYVNNTVVSTVGSYTFYSYIEYTDSTYGVVIRSSESSKSFMIRDSSSVFAIPIFTQVYNVTMKGIDLKIDLNTTTTNGYTHVIKNVTTGHTYTSGEYTSTIDTDGSIIWTLPMYTEGIFDIEVKVTFGGIQEIVNTTVSVFKVSEPTGGTTILNSITYVDSDISDTNPLYNNATLRTGSSIDDENTITIASVEFTSNPADNYKIVLTDGADIQIYEKANVSVKRYIINSAVRDQLFSHDSRVGTLLVTTTLPGSHNLEAYQNVNLSGIDHSTAPSTPTLLITSDNKLTPFSSTGSTDCIVKNGLTFNLTNVSSSYSIESLIDGVPYNNNTLYTISGKHVYLAIYRDKHNFLTSFKKVNFEIVRDNMYSDPIIDFSPKDVYVENFTIEIDYQFFDQEDTMTIDKQYKTSIDNVWHPYTGTFTINSPCTVYAKKTMQNGFTLYSELVITAKMLMSNTPEVPILNLPSSEFANGSVYIPVVYKVLGCNYEWTLNGVPYVEGTPIINSSSTSRSYSLTVKATDRRNSKFASKQLSFTIDNIPPEKPYLTNLVDQSIILHNNATLVVNNPELGVEYSIIVNNKLQNTLDLGINRVVVYAKRLSNGMVNFSSYYVETMDHDNVLTFDTLNIERNKLVPYNRENAQFDSPGELVVDNVTGDVSIVSNTLNPNGVGYVLIDVTKDIRSVVLDCNRRVLDGLLLSNKFKEQMRHLTDSFTYLLENGNTLDSTILVLNGKILLFDADIDALLAEAVQLRNELDLTTLSIDNKKSDFDLNSPTAVQNLNTSIARVNALREEFIDQMKSYNLIMSEVGLDKFNLNSIDLTADKKVLQSDFNAFKTKHNNFYQSLSSIVRNF